MPALYRTPAVGDRDLRPQWLTGRAPVERLRIGVCSSAREERSSLHTTQGPRVNLPIVILTVETNYPARLRC